MFFVVLRSENVSVDKLCIVTVVDHVESEWVSELFMSIRVLSHANSGWNIVWSVQDDSGDGKYGWLENRSDVVSYEKNLGVKGVTVSRRAAVQRHVDASAVIFLDQDDMISVDGFLYALNILDREPDIGWLIGAVSYREKSGEEHKFVCPFPEGRVDSGTEFVDWISKNANPYMLGFLGRMNSWNHVMGSLSGSEMIGGVESVVGVCDQFDGWVHHETLVVCRDMMGKNSGQGLLSSAFECDEWG